MPASPYLYDNHSLQQPKPTHQTSTMVTACVRGGDILGGAQKIQNLFPADVPELIHLLRTRLRHKRQQDHVRIDHLRYHCAETQQWLLLEDLKDVENEDKLILEVGAERDERDAWERLVYTTLTFSQMAKRVAGDAAVVTTFESFSPMRSPEEVLNAADAEAVSAAVHKVNNSLTENQEEVVMAYLIDSLRTMSVSAVELQQAALDSPRNRGARSVKTPDRAWGEPPTAATPNRYPVATPSQLPSVKSGRLMCAADEEMRAQLLKTKSLRSIYSKLRGQTRQKVVLVDPNEPSCFESLRRQFEVKFKLPPRSAEFHYEDAEGYRWEIVDTDSFREFLSKVAEGSKAELTTIPAVTRPATAVTVDSSAERKKRKARPHTATPHARSEGGQLVTHDTANLIRAERDQADANDPDDAYYEKRDRFLRAKWKNYLTRYDTDASGTLSAEELCRMLRGEGSLAWLDDEGMQPPGSASFLSKKVCEILKQVCPF